VKGLTSEQVEKSREENGTNKLTEQKGETILQKVLDSLKEPINSLLVVMSIISLALAYLGYVNIATPLGILLALALATLVAVFSEAKSDKIFEALKESEEILVKVYRDDEVKQVPINDIVVGDEVIIQAGDGIPADGYIIDGKIRVNQATINGESDETLKIAITQDTNTEQLAQSSEVSNANLVFRGTTVTDNSAVMKVTKVGDKTVYGAISQEVQEDDGIETPLKAKLGVLAKQISLMGYIGAALIAIVIVVKALAVDHVLDENMGELIAVLINAVTMALSIIVMAVPEGLPMLISLVCTLNMRKMYNENVLVRNTNDIETAGSLNILFSDKTGTITVGRLEVEEIVPEENAENHIFTNMIVNNDSKMSSDGAIGGNPTDRSLLRYINEKHSDLCELKYNSVDSIKFNSTNKYSAVTVLKDDEVITYIKGAPEIIAKMCGIKNCNISEMANKAMRVLGFAHIEGSISKNKLPDKKPVFDGLVGIRDGVREDAKEAVKTLQDAGIQVVMVTGDCHETAIAIAKEANLITENSISITSEELNKKSDDEVKKILPKLAVVSRALPTDKSRLVKLAQEIGLVAGMTGDGTNDAPALKKADVGFAMGSGTQVAKSACGITILDDSLKSISKAVLYGRTIYHNIQKFLIYQLTINVSAMVICLLGPIIGMDEPLTVPQILVVNIIMDTLAAIAIGAEPVLAEYMQEKPKQRTENVLTKYILSAIGVSAVWVTLCGVAMLKTDLFSNLILPQHLGTAYFTMFVMFSVFNGFNVRTTDGDLFNKIAENKSFICVMGAIVIAQILIAQFGGSLFNCYGLTIIEWCLVTIIGLTLIPIDMIRKFIINLAKK
jgi:calcium-translocating P-type ATPase